MLFMRAWIKPTHEPAEVNRRAAASFALLWFTSCGVTGLIDPHRAARGLPGRPAFFSTASPAASILIGRVPLARRAASLV